MKARFSAYLLLFASMAIISCSKNGDNPQNSNGDSLFVRMQQGIIPNDDTVFLVKYDANKRIKQVINSTYVDTLTATYSDEGNLISIDTKKGMFSSTPVIYTYNADNQLIEINFDAAGYPGRYVFEYTNGIISKQTYYTITNLTVPTLRVSRYFSYGVTNGNITSIKEYDALNQLLGETTLTYTSDPNVFKPIALLNHSNTLGLSEVANRETFFNKNLIATSTSGDIKTTYTYTYTSKKQLAKFVVSSPDAIYTRMLSY